MWIFFEILAAIYAVAFAWFWFVGRAFDRRKPPVLAMATLSILRRNSQRSGSTVIQLTAIACESSSPRPSASNIIPFERGLRLHSHKASQAM